MKIHNFLSCHTNELNSGPPKYLSVLQKQTHTQQSVVSDTNKTNAKLQQKTNLKKKINSASNTCFCILCEEK